MSDIVYYTGPHSPNHPLIFAKHLRTDHRVKNGSVATLVHQDSGDVLGKGFYNGHARVGFRLLTRDAPIDEAWIESQILAALRRRKSLGFAQEGSAFRLVNSEGDGLSGLVVDIYNKLAVIQFYAAGMYWLRHEILRVLQRHLAIDDWYWFAERRHQKQESFDCRYPQRDLPQTIIEEGPCRFHIDLDAGHKTGFYLDQSSQREFLRQMTRTDQRVLDLCTFSGGFAISAAIRGAQVIAVDLDPKAIALAQKNADLNGLTVDFQTADLYQWLAAAPKFDTVILDPAKLTTEAQRVDQALKQYTHMNTLALKCVKPGGVFVSCSCTGLVSERDFLEVLRRASLHAGRRLSVFRVSGASEDHPFDIESQTGRYLKVVWASVD